MARVFPIKAWLLAIIFQLLCLICLFFFFNDTATTEIYTLSLHDALPICDRCILANGALVGGHCVLEDGVRSEEHTSELQSLRHLVCRLLLEKKKTNNSS